MTQSICNPFKKGDIITMPSLYKRRTFWQWVKREPRQLQQFKIIDDVTSHEYGEFFRYERYQ